MPVLKNPRHERFALLLAEGLSAYAAYEQAGYKPHDGNCIRLRGNERVQVRLAELQRAAQKKTEVTIESLMAELEEARVKAVSLDQMSAAVKSISEKAKISGLLVQKIEVGSPNEFEALDTIPDILEKVRHDLGPDGAELVAAICGLNAESEKGVKCETRASFRRKLGRYKWRMVDKRLLIDAIGRDVDVEITDEDVARLRGLMRDFDGLIDDIRARVAKPVNAVDPVQVERRRLSGPNGGNGRQR
jgi:hypothetical protein